MKQKKKAIAIIVSVMMVFTLIPATAYASTATKLGVTLNTATWVDGTNKAKYNFDNVTVEGDGIQLITVSADKQISMDNSTDSAIKQPSKTLSSIVGASTTTKSYYFSPALNKVETIAFIKGITFGYVANTVVSVEISNAGNNLPTVADTTIVKGDNSYYMYVPEQVSWTAAYDNAKKYQFNGLIGYLATITSEAEDQLLTSISSAGAWAGGTRALKNDLSTKINDELTCNSAGGTSGKETIEKEFYWACGPEAGTVYWKGIGNELVNKVDGKYSNWLSGVEPNNYPNEHCLQVNDDSDTEGVYKWNDLNNSNTSNRVSGYFVEFTDYERGRATGITADNKATDIKVVTVDAEKIILESLNVIIAGNTTIGSEITATVSVSNVTYQWYADNVEIQGATDSTYITKDGDAGKTITVKATFALGTTTTTTTSNDIIVDTNGGTVNPPVVWILPTVGTDAPIIIESADKPLFLTKNDGTYALKEVKLGDRTLVEGKDYTMKYNEITFSQDFLKTLAVGDNKVTFCYNGLYTLDKVITVKEKEVPIIENPLEDLRLVARSKLINEKRVKVRWHAKKGDIKNADGFEMFRSLKRYSGYGNEPFATTGKKAYRYDNLVKIGDKYYYKVRAYKVIDGETYYSPWSLKAWRTIYQD